MTADDLTDLSNLKPLSRDFFDGEDADRMYPSGSGRLAGELTV